MKKLGKILLFGAAVGTAAAAAYHYFQKMEKENEKATPETDEDAPVSDDDYSYFDDDDFDDALDLTALQDEDFDVDFDDPTPDTDIEDMATTSPAPSFSPLSETLMQEQDVEEFFDEDSDDITEE